MNAIEFEAMRNAASCLDQVLNGSGAIDIQAIDEALTELNNHIRAYEPERKVTS